MLNIFYQHALLRGTLVTPKLWGEEHFYFSESCYLYLM